MGKLIEYRVGELLLWLLQRSYPAERKEYLSLCVRLLLEDHQKHPISLPKSSVDMNYAHQSSSSSWCHFLEPQECSDYPLLFSIISIGELSRSNKARHYLLQSGIAPALESVLERADADPVILPELIRALCHLVHNGKHNDALRLFLIIADGFRSQMLLSDSWMSEIQRWLDSPNSRVLLFTTLLISVLLEDGKLAVCRKYALSLW